MRRYEIPSAAGTYQLTLTVRSYETGESGAVGPGTILRYLEHLATQASNSRGFDHAWYERTGSAWVVREMRVRLGLLPGIDEELVMATWLSDLRRVQAFREYAIWRRHGGNVVARAQARWAFVDRRRGQLLRIPDELLSSFSVAGQSMGPLQWQSDAAMPSESEPRSYRASLSARTYEMDSQHHINNCVYVDWLDEAVRSAVGGPPDDEANRGRSLCPRSYHIEYVSQMRAGDEVHIETRWSKAGTRGVTARQDMTTGGGGSVVRAHSLYLLC
jgi:acyl-CoA thioesterase FadM